MSFPDSPVDGFIYKGLRYNFDEMCWKKITECLCGEYRLAQNYTHPGGTWTTLPVNYRKYSNLNESFDIINHRWTLKNPGKYRVTITGYSYICSNGQRYAYGVSKNGSLTGFSGGIYAISGDSPLITHSCIMSVNGTTDWIDIKIFSAVAGIMVGGVGEGGHYFAVYIDYLGL